ncbi:MAG: sigma-70 family RNA polymerase sigma factor [Phycisphaeraceae bacterium]
MPHRDDHPDWRSLLRTHGPALVLLARQRGLPAADAEDVVQEAFINLWKKADEGSPVRDHAAYLFACVRHGALDCVRGQSRRRQRETSAAQDSAETIDLLFENNAEQEELAARVQVLLHDLPDEQREVVVMKVWGGLTFAQIAEATEQSPHTVASRYRYALAAMRGLLATEMQT